MHQITEAELNHLRRLLGWMRCEVGQTPEEQRETMRSIAHALTEYPDEAAQGRLMESYDRAASIPKYVRAAIKSLARVVREQTGEIVEAKRETNRLEAPGAQEKFNAAARQNLIAVMKPPSGE